MHIESVIKCYKFLSIGDYIRKRWSYTCRLEVDGRLIFDEKDSVSEFLAGLDCIYRCLGTGSHSNSWFLCNKINIDE